MIKIIFTSKSGYDRSSEVALFDYLNQVSASHKKDQSKSIKILEDQGRGNKKRLLNQVIDYSHKNVSDKVIRIIMSYTEYVNRVVWKKY